MNSQNRAYLKELARVNKLPYDVLMAIVAVETPGVGFDKATGKILIQFEPSWFRKKEPFAPSGKWSLNKVDIQAREWPAFNSAFAIDPDSAMECTSIGLPQIMGFHWKRLGYSSVGAMWDDFKRGEYQQLCALVRFILTDPQLLQAVKTRNWYKIAYIYNGANFVEMAKRWGRERYDLSLEKEAAKWTNK